MRTAILALLAQSCFGAIAFVQATNGGGTTTVNATAISTTTGNLLYVFSRGGSTHCNGVTATVTDTAGNTFRRIGLFTSYTSPSGACDGVWYAKNITGNASNVVSITWSTSQSFSTLSVLEFSGVDTSIPLDASAVTQITNTAGTVATSGAFSTVAANEVIIASGEWRGTGNTFTAGTGYTIPSGATDGNSISTSEYKIVSSTQSGVTASLTSSASLVNGLVVTTFKQATVTAGTITYVQGVVNADSSSYTTSAAAPAISTTTGNAIVVFVRVDRIDSMTNAQACSGLISVSDTVSNTYTQVGTIVTADNVAHTAGECLIAFLALNITGNSSTTITASATPSLRRWALSVQEFSGVAAYDTTASATSTGATSLTSSSFSTVSANEVILVAGEQGKEGVLFTAGAGYQIPVEATTFDGTGGSGGSTSVEWAVVSSTQSGVTASMTFDSSTRCGLLVITLSQSALSGGSGAARRRGAIIF